MNREENRALWSKRIADYRASELVAKDWCQENNVSIHTLRYWIHKSNKERLHRPPEQQWVALQPMTPNQTEQESAAFIVRIGRASIEVQPGFDEHTFKLLARILAEQC